MTKPSDRKGVPAMFAIMLASLVIIDPLYVNDVPDPAPAKVVLDPGNLGNLVEQNAWVAVAAVVTGLFVRLFKTDTVLPTIPPRARIWAAFLFGIATGVFEKIATGTTWKKAIVDGLVGAALAVLGHETIIASLRAGKEIPVPGLTKEGVPPAPTAPPTIPPGRG